MLTIEQIRSAIAASGVQFDAQNIDINATFESLGMDSLDNFNIIIEIQDRTGLEIPDSDLGQLQTIAGIAEYLNK